MKYLIVGLGSMGNRRARNLIELGVDRKFILGFDPSEQRRTEFFNNHQIDVCDSILNAMKNPLKVVIISTPPDTHMEYALIAAKASIPFFVEAGTSLEGMSEVLKLAQEKKIVAAPSCTLRFHPSIVHIKSLLDSGAIGKVLAFTHHCGQYLPDWHPWEDYRAFYVSKRKTGACREIVPFELNWLIWLLGWPSLVTGYKEKVSDLECDIDDIYQVLIRFENQILGFLQVDVIARKATRHLRILGSEGSIEWNAVEKTLRVYNSITADEQVYTEDSLIVKEGYSDMSPEQMYVNELGAFLDAVDRKNVYPHTLEEDIKILNILLNVEKSSDTGSVLSVNESDRSCT